MWSADGRRRTIVESDDDTFDDENPLFVLLNGDPICGIDLHAIPNKKKRKKRDVTENQYLLKGECKIFQKKTTHVFSDCVDTNTVKNEMWV